VGTGELVRTDKPVSRKGAKNAKSAKKNKDHHIVVLCALVRQPTDELFWFFLLTPGSCAATEAEQS